MFIKSIIVFYIYFIFDVVYSFIEKYQEDKDRDLAVDHYKLSKKMQMDYDELAKTQKRFERDRKIKENSLKLLNKLIAVGLIRESDLLSFTRSSEYFQLFVYSASVGRRREAIVAGIDPDTLPDRKYPQFLQELGFARLGQRSTFFLIKKSRLKDYKLQKVKNMKKFLLHHFSKIRREEWSQFLAKVKEVNNKQFKNLEGEDVEKLGYLKNNFLLTETNMNPTNIGMVDNEYLGLGAVSRNDFIIEQILEKSKSGAIEVNEQFKVKIRKIIQKLDITFLLEGIKIADRNIIDLKQDLIKDNLDVENVTDFHKINISDLTSELVSIGLDKKKSRKIANQIVKTTKVYKNALTELQITI